MPDQPVSAYAVIKLEQYALTEDRRFCLLRFRDERNEAFVLAVPVEELPAMRDAIDHATSRLAADGAALGAIRH